MSCVKCLICWTDTTSEPSGGNNEVDSQVKSEKSPEEECPLERQLNAIFVLRVLLKVPPSSLQSYFQLSSGEHPSHWMKLCGECGDLVDNARAVYNQFIAARQKVREYQKRISDRVKEVSRKLYTEEEDEEITSGGYQEEIGGHVRDFVEKQNYDVVNPFISGDQRAAALLTKRENPPTEPASESDDPPDSPPVFDDPDFDVDSSDRDDVTPPPKKKASRRTPRSYPCPECHDTFPSVRLRATHKRAAHRTTQKEHNFRCSRCDLTFTSPHYKHLHYQEVHKGLTQAQIYAAKHQRDRERYLKTKRSVKCPHCDYRGIVNSVNRHVARMHNPDLPFICDLCGQRLKLRDGLEYHQAKEHHKCSVTDCDFRGEGRKELRDHQVKCHGKEVDAFRCDECEGVFIRAEHLRRHQEIHERERIAKEEGAEGVKRFQCDVCGKYYSTSNSLQSHRGFAHPQKKQRKEKAST